MNTTGLLKVGNPKIILTGITISGESRWMEKNRITGEVRSEALHGNMILRQRCIIFTCFPESSRIWTGKMKRFVRKFTIWWISGVKKESTVSEWTWSAWSPRISHIRMEKWMEDYTVILVLTASMVRGSMSFFRKWTERFYPDTMWWQLEKPPVWLSKRHRNMQVRTEMSWTWCFSLSM